MSETIAFPNEFKKLIGTEQAYSQGGKIKATGIVQDLRFASSYIMELKTKKRWRSIQLKIKPNNGARAFWTTGFKTKIPYND